MPSFKLPSWLSERFNKIIHINDSPQRVALGFGLGIFLGILPGVGPVASLVLAAFFRVNPVAAVTGSLLTNTWFSIVTFAVALKLGSAALGTDWAAVHDRARELMAHFRFRTLLDPAWLDVLKPLFLGYAIVGFVAGAAGYLTALAVLAARRRGGPPAA